MSSQIHTNLDRYHQIYIQKWKCVIVLQKNKLILVGFSKPRISNEVIHIRLNAGSFLLNPTLISCNLWSNFQPVRLVGSYHCWFVKKYYWLVCVKEKYCSGWKFTIVYDKPQPNEQAESLSSQNKKLEQANNIHLSGSVTTEGPGAWAAGLAHADWAAWRRPFVWLDRHNVSMTPGPMNEHKKLRWSSFDPLDPCMHGG